VEPIGADLIDDPYAYEDVVRGAGSQVDNIDDPNAYEDVVRGGALKQQQLDPKTNPFAPGFGQANVSTNAARQKSTSPPLPPLPEPAAPPAVRMVHTYVNVPVGEQ
jgi:hypothetical protein